MLFSSYDFVLVFLPICFAGYYTLTLLRQRLLGVLWLIVMSLGFYAWWNPRDVIVLVVLSVVNYGLGVHIARTRSTPLMWLGVVANLATLAWFKYALFVSGELNALFGTDWSLGKIVLPLGISFFIFQKIGWLVDAREGKIHDYTPVNYLLFVTFFPQLIAGPIVHHGTIMPQIQQGQSRREIPADFLVGFSMFIVGLAKKVLIADRLSPLAGAAFSIGAEGSPVGLAGAWLSVLAYTLQIYFDFSAYSDMALGLGRMCGFRLPLNFNSPYKALNIIDFWRRWHITLSDFLRQYLYIPLGGNKKGPLRRYINLLLTMVIGGFWHGANWTFVFWGMLHGLYLILNHAWRHAAAQFLGGWKVPVGVAWLMTILCVIVAWVPFRAENMDTTLRLYAEMTGQGGPVFMAWLTDDLLFGPPELLLRRAFVTAGLSSVMSGVLTHGGLVAAAGVIALCLPNTVQIFSRFFQPATREVTLTGPLSRVLAWKPTLIWTLALSLLFAVTLIFMRRNASFLYFQF